MMNAIQTKKEKGFTLIELVMVIVILGILAAFALPRFADLGGEAERASVEGARGSVKSAMGIVRSTALAQGKGAETTGDPATDSDTVTLEGTQIDLLNGFLAASSLEDAAQLGDYTVTVNNSNAVITVGDPSDGSPCFNFTGSSNADTPPSVSDVISEYDTDDGSCST